MLVYLNRLPAGMLPEYEALAALLEKEPEWRRDASALRLRMLSILSTIAESYIQSGKHLTLLFLTDYLS